MASKKYIIPITIHIIKRSARAQIIIATYSKTPKIYAIGPANQTIAGGIVYQIVPIKSQKVGVKISQNQNHILIGNAKITLIPSNSTPEALTEQLVKDKTQKINIL